MEAVQGIRQKVTSYQPSKAVQMALGSARILLLVAISGGGKDTIKHRLLNTGNYRHIISYTTRPPRANNGVREQDGIDYHFIDSHEAERLLDNGLLIESDVYAGHMYGTGIAEIKAARTNDRIAVTDITIEGALEYLALAPTVKVAFLLPPSFEVWMERLMKRYSGDHHNQDIRLRMQEAVGEIELALASDKMYIVINDDLNATVALVDDIAHNKPVDPHDQGSIAVARRLLRRLKHELAFAPVQNTLP